MLGCFSCGIPLFNKFVQGLYPRLKLRLRLGGLVPGRFLGLAQLGLMIFAQLVKLSLAVRIRRGPLLLLLDGGLPIGALAACSIIINEGS